MSICQGLLFFSINLLSYTSLSFFNSIFAALTFDLGLHILTIPRELFFLKREQICEDLTNKELCTSLHELLSSSSDSFIRLKYLSSLDYSEIFAILVVRWQTSRHSHMISICDFSFSH